MGLIYFTSDLHLDHANIIKYCQRPFYSIGEMNAALIANWNARVTPDDTVYLLGDFALTSRERIAELRDALNGSIVLVLGNHDRSAAAMRECGFEEAHAAQREMIGGRMVYMSHIPDYGIRGLHLCGHVHTDWKRYGDIINVGVDQWNFRPVTLEELLAAEQTDMRGRETRRPVPGRGQ